MRRGFIRLFGVVVLLLLVGLVWARLFAGGPVSFIPGGRLSGEVVNEPVDDWSFVASHHYLLIESGARMLPYSKNVWFMVHQGDLYVLLPSLFGDELRQRLLLDPLVRVEVAGKVYEQRAKEVEGDALVGELMAPVLRRIGSIELSGAVRRPLGASQLEGASMAIFLLENR